MHAPVDDRLELMAARGRPNAPSAIACARKVSFPMAPKEPQGTAAAAIPGHR
ncbi:hypothetical protein AB0D04_00610 [Streptomyces sp. NPDC048483]|uniref:hypothetical protein n=1 Tax=Streptomyces sp. NPDC048483 TaxID=3154927 RepID=UPI00343FD367